MGIDMKEARRIIKSGSSLVVTLPSIWIQHHGLGKGDELELTWDFDAITIRPVRMVPAE